MYNDIIMYNDTHTHVCVCVCLLIAEREEFHIQGVNWLKWVNFMHLVPSLFLLCVPQIFGLEFLLGSDTLWPLLLALTILPAVLQTIMLPFCPESPRYLFIVLKQEEEARKGQS